MNLAHNFGEGEAKSGGNNEILKVQTTVFFSILLPIFGIRGANLSPAKCKGVF